MGEIGGARTFARAKPRHLCMSETDDDVRPCMQLKADFRIMQPCFISATDVLHLFRNFKTCLATTNILNPHTHSHTHTHACRSLVFFLIFESTHSVLYRAILLSSSRPSTNPSWRQYARKAFSCTHIDGQRGVWCSFNRVLLLLPFSSISNYDNIQFCIFSK